jgi:hypothetical protein
VGIARHQREGHPVARPGPTSSGTPRTIEQLDPVTAQAQFSVTELADNGIYEIAPATDEHELFAGILRNLTGLARYYRDIAYRGLDLIIKVDLSLTRVRPGSE